ncbi:MAG: hypothetical protein SVJ22_06600, partial [Halobacteriota archaeon]|nr:hypothetical protein [Halobacteriota archaeon]
MEMDQVYAKRKRSKRRTAAYLVLIIFILSILLISFHIYGMMGGFAIPRERVSVIYVQGTMVSENVPSGAGFASSEQICSELRS